MSSYHFAAASRSSITTGSNRSGSAIHSTPKLVTTNRLRRADRWHGWSCPGSASAIRPSLGVNPFFVGRQAGNSVSQAPAQHTLDTQLNHNRTPRTPATTPHRELTELTNEMTVRSDTRFRALVPDRSVGIGRTTYLSTSPQFPSVFETGDRETDRRAAGIRDETVVAVLVNNLVSIRIKFVPAHLRNDVVFASVATG